MEREWNLRTSGVSPIIAGPWLDPFRKLEVWFKLCYDLWLVTAFSLAKRRYPYIEMVAAYECMYHV
jgi:hypothetical protein